MRILRTVVRVSAVAAFLGLLFGFLNSLFSLADSISHFRFHVSLALLVISVVLALLRSFRFAFATLVAAAAGVAMMYPALPFMGGNENENDGIKFIQFNTLFNNPRIPRSVEWLTEQSPDILALEEVSSKTIAIHDAMALQMPSHVFCKFAGVGGVAVLSKFPKFNEKCIEKTGLVWMQIDMNGKPVTVAALHLHWPYPYGQWKQLANLRDEFEAMPRPVILAGDFNATPWSEALKRMQVMTGTQIVPGFRLTLRKGFPLVGVVPFLPIDHFLIDPSLTVKGIWVGPQIGSDHLPIVSILKRLGS
jgi:endonuclease/exonuclease/phosphatase (EEP) superfamily protein YafD